MSGQGRRELGTAVLGAVLAGALALIAGGQAWATVTAQRRPPLPPVSAELSGAPKVRAMEIIESLEPVRRNLYGGCVGYLGASGDMDMAIAIRTAVLHQGKAYVQAGAGIVADSDPATEEAETRHKARAVLSAIATAEGLRELR